MYLKDGLSQHFSELPPTKPLQPAHVHWGNLEGVVSFWLTCHHVKNSFPFHMNHIYPFPSFQMSKGSIQTTSVSCKIDPLACFVWPKIQLHIPSFWCRCHSVSVNWSEGKVRWGKLGGNLPWWSWANLPGFVMVCMVILSDSWHL